MPQETGCTIKLPAASDLSNAHDLAEHLIAAASQGEALLIDGADVDRIGTPAIQVLVAAAFEAEKEGRRFQIAPSEPLEAAFSDLGFGKEYEKWSSE